MRFCQRTTHTHRSINIVHHLLFSAARARSRFFLPSEPGGLPRRRTLVVVELKGITLILEITPVAAGRGRPLPRLTSVPSTLGVAAAAAEAGAFLAGGPFFVILLRIGGGGGGSIISTGPSTLTVRLLPPAPLPVTPGAAPPPCSHASQHSLNGSLRMLPP